MGEFVPGKPRLADLGYSVLATSIALFLPTTVLVARPGLMPDDMARCHQPTMRAVVPTPIHRGRHRGGIAAAAARGAHTERPQMTYQPISISEEVPKRNQ